jgi:type II secretory pathway pseudopilin PulG
MKPINGNQSRRIGFTIIELLTVMSIIVILISLLAPALNRVRRYATDVKQKAQFHSVAVALDMFNAEFDGYPDSNGVDDYGNGNNYCGAMRLAEAMVGQDLKGFNPSSRFQRRGFPNRSDSLWDGMPYPPYNTCGVTGGATGAACYNENIRSRKMYLELEHANAYLLSDIYDSGVISSAVAGLSGPPAVGFDPCTYVLCDSYNRVTNKTTGRKMGMPILYYRADPAKYLFPTIGTSPPTMSGTGLMGAYYYTYNFYDNQALIQMGMPWIPSNTYVHRLASAGTTPEGFYIANINACPEEFYRIIRDPKVPSGDKPYRVNSYILISAGFDGEYGTSDDIYNFGD